MSLMYDRSIHRIPVLRDGKVVGLVTAMDVVRMVADGKQE
jgi:signal-transduction protein with cAMP-binding, CBS, and nucleotidyltransferase domain